jgi:8-amino-7-oxononanoate synthase
MSQSVDPTLWSRRIRAQLDAVVDEGRWRSPRDFDALGPIGVLEGNGVVAFASNDYLGLSAHPAVIAAAHQALDRWGTGAGASRLVTGSRPVHGELERALAQWKGTAAAVCFPTGFAANLGALSVLGGPEVRVLSDELNHASIIDGCRLSRSQLSVYRHADVDHLAELLSAGPSGTPTVVVTDTVFSMDGDQAPLADIVEVCRARGALLLLDEAHAVMGPAVPTTHTEHDDPLTIVRVGTLSKTLGAVGGFIAAPQDIVDLLVNRARPYIFSTALAPADVAAALAALGVVRSPEGADLVARLTTSVARVAGELLGRPDHASPIIPLILGSEQRALEASTALLAAGLWVPAIRPPTVPVGTSRLRITLSAAHTDQQVTGLLEAVAALSLLDSADNAAVLPASIR